MKASPEQDREHQHQGEHPDKPKHAAGVREDEVGFADLEQSELTLRSPFDAESAPST